MQAAIKRTLVITIIALMVVFLLVTAWDFFWDEPYQETSSQSEREALSRGTWQKSLQASPPAFEVQGQTFHIDSAWVEQLSHRTERLWGTSETRLKGYSLCFTLAEHSIPNTHYFTTEDDSDPITERTWSEMIVTYTADLERPEDATQLQFTMTRTGMHDDPNPHRFKFTTKP